MQQEWRQRYHPEAWKSRNLPVMKILTIFVIDIKDHLMLEVIAINTFESSSDAFDSIWNRVCIIRTISASMFLNSPHLQLFRLISCQVFTHCSKTICALSTWKTSSLVNPKIPRSCSTKRLHSVGKIPKMFHLNFNVRKEWLIQILEI